MRARRLGRTARAAAALAGVVGLLAVGSSSTVVAKPTRPLEAAPASASLPSPPRTAPEDRAAIVVVVDGARWQDVVGETRMMPHLAELAREHGRALGDDASGVVVRASGPSFVSLPGYAEILGGAPDPSCPNNDDCLPTTRATLADAVRAWAGDPDDAAVLASWADLAKVASDDPTRVVVSAGRTLATNDARMRRDPEMAELLDRGARAASWPGGDDYRPDRITARLAERYAEVVRPRFLFVSLGDTDEYAHKGMRPGYVAALRFADEVIARLYDETHGASAHGRRTAMYVMADHGRAFDFCDHGARWPESARSWLVVLDDDSIPSASDLTLSAVAPMVRAWLGVQQPPTRMASVALSVPAPEN